MALIFAQKGGYEVDSNQELVAQVNAHPYLYVIYFSKYNKHIYITLICIITKRNLYRDWEIL